MISYLQNWKNAHQLEILLFIIIVVVSTVFVARRRMKDVCFRRGVIITGCIYTFFVLCFTVLFREPNKEHTYNHELFWSYRLALSNRGYLEEIGLNILLFVPLGILAASLIEKRRMCLYGAVIAFTGMLSVSIEVLQYNMKCGFSELDDVVSNVLGAIFGIALWKIMRMLFWRYK